MAWKDTLLDASFRGVPFDVLRTSDRGERALVEHEYPYRTGAEIEDMGRKARRISITAVFYGEDYEERLDNLLKALEVSGSGELIHPVFGSITVCVGPYTVPHDAEKPDYCEVTLEFVEAELDNAFLGASGRQSKADELALQSDAALNAAQENTEISFTDWLRSQAKELSIAEQLDVLNVLSGALDELNNAERIVNDVISYLDFPQAYLSDIEAVMSVASGSSLPISGFSGWTRLSTMFSSFDIGGGSSTSYPTGTAQYTTPTMSGPSTGRADVSPFMESTKKPSTFVRTVTAPNMKRATGATKAMTAVLINVKQTVLLGKAITPLFCAEVKKPTLTTYEVEAVVGNARQRIQDCIDDVRIVLPDEKLYAIVESLRNAAYSIQELGAELLAVLPPLTTYTVPSLCNLHLLAHRLYGDYSRADEIARLNPSLFNPNFIAQGQKIVIYAR